MGLGCFGVKISDSDSDSDSESDRQSGAPIIPTMNLRQNPVVLDQKQQWTSDDNDEFDQSPTRIISAPESPELVSLIELLRRQDQLEKNTEVGSIENTFICCVCMGRKNRSVLIPCGHTFCGACSRKLSFVHGTCPVCHYPFSEFLDIV
ncbi:hypothetical protein AgCh_019178 [Apium graveolens]